MNKKSALLSFGLRALEVLRALKTGNPMMDATVDRLISLGWASRTTNGQVQLTIAGIQAHQMFEALDAVPEDQVEVLEKLSGLLSPQEFVERTPSIRPK